MADDSTLVESQPTNVELIAKHVRDRARALGIGASDLQRAMDVPSSTLFNYWSGKRIWPTELLVPLARELRTSVAAILSEKRIRDDEDGPPPDRDLVEVNRIDLAYGMGGAFADSPIAVETLHFPRSWIESITHTPPALLTFAAGRGDSMAPTIQDGDITLIDHSVQTVREQDAIWAFTVGDIAMIKRLRIRGEQVTILSDNDRVPDDVASPDEINIVGRIIFIGRKV